MDITINWFQSNALNQMFCFFLNSFFILMVMSFQKMKNSPNSLFSLRDWRSQWVFWNKILIQFSSILFEDAYSIPFRSLHEYPNKCCNRPEISIFLLFAIFKCFPLRNLSACRHYSMHKTYVCITEANHGGAVILKMFPSSCYCCVCVCFLFDWMIALLLFLGG